MGARSGRRECTKLSNNFLRPLFRNFNFDDIYLRSFGGSESNAVIKMVWGQDFYVLSIY